MYTQHFSLIMLVVSRYFCLVLVKMWVGRNCFIEIPAAGTSMK